MQTQQRVAAYGLEGQGRSMCPCPSAREDRCRFLAATAVSVGPDGDGNKVCLIEYDSTAHRVSCEAVWGVAGGPVAEVRCSHSFPGEGDTRCMLVSLINGGAATLHIMSEGSTGIHFSQVGEFPKGVSGVVWDPRREDHTAVRVIVGRTVQPATLVLNGGRYSVQLGAAVDCGAPVLSCAWDPADAVGRVAVATELGLGMVDANKAVYSELCRVAGRGGTPSPHGTGRISVVAFCPGQSNTMVTGAEDGTVAVWNTSNSTVQSVHHLHSHWVLDVAVNRLSSNLLLSGGADRCAYLTYLHTKPAGSTKTKNTSNEGWGAMLVGPAAAPKREEAVTRTPVGDLGDSVCAVCWAYDSTFVMAAMAFNGRVLISPVEDGLRKQILREV